MITYQATYKIDLAKIEHFEAYAKAWIPLVERFGGTHHGYFLPHEGPNDLGFAAYDFAVRTNCFLRYDRHFLRPVLEGDPSGIRDQRA